MWSSYPAPCWQRGLAAVAGHLLFSPVLKKLPQNWRKKEENVPSVFWFDFNSSLTISSLTFFANTTEKKSLLNNSVLRVNWAWGELLNSQVCGLWFLLLTAHMDFKPCLCNQWFLSLLWMLQFCLAFHPLMPALWSCEYMWRSLEGPSCYRGETQLVCYTELLPGWSSACI